jgi:hypothetical protein
MEPPARHRPAAVLHGQPHVTKERFDLVGLAFASACVNETRDFRKAADEAEIIAINDG